MLATIEQLQGIPLFSTLNQQELASIQTFTLIQNFRGGEIVMSEGENLPRCLFIVLSGSIRVSRITSAGKETIFRVLGSGEVFAATALVGNGIAPATVTASIDSQILSIQRQGLLESIGNHPEIALQMLAIFNHRLQKLHDTLHGLISQKAIARLIHYIQVNAREHGIESTEEGDLLKVELPYYQIARSIGITYEECVRLFQRLKGVVSYRRGGRIIVQDWQKLEIIAQDEY